MEHDEAVRSKAAERYVAHELSAAEQDAFEEHLFDCPECADEVRLELTFSVNARAVAREPQPRPQQTGGKWLGWLRPSPAMGLSLAANLALAAGLALVLVEHAREAGQPRLARIYFAPGPAHGAADVHVLGRGDRFYGVRFLAPSQKSLSYFYEILDVSGRRESSGFLAAPSMEDAELSVQAPVEGLPNGVHTLQIRACGADGDIVSRSRFQSSR